MSTETNVMPTPAGVRPPVTLKCTSPATVAAMRIARSAGLVTSTMGSPMGAAPRKGGDAGDGGGTLLVYDDEKENIDPVTGTHARLASGASASRRASANDSLEAALGGSREETRPDAPPRPPLADITAKFHPPVPLKPGKSVIRPAVESVTTAEAERIDAAARLSRDAAAAAPPAPPEGRVDDASRSEDAAATAPAAAARRAPATGAKRAAASSRDAKRARVLRFVIR